MVALGGSRAKNTHARSSNSLLVFNLYYVRAHDCVRSIKHRPLVVCKCTSTVLQENSTAVAPSELVLHGSMPELQWVHSLRSSVTIQDKPRSCEDANGLSRSILVKVQGFILAVVVPHGRELNHTRLGKLCQAPCRCVPTGNSFYCSTPAGTTRHVSMDAVRSQSSLMQQVHHSNQWSPVQVLFLTQAPQGRLTSHSSLTWISCPSLTCYWEPTAAQVSLNSQWRLPSRSHAVLCTK